MHYRSVLFVPGNRPDRFEKAMGAGADLVCIDLEDAVGLNDKDAAREDVLKFLKNNQNLNVSLRINGVLTDEGRADIAALKASDLKLPFVMIPKIASRSEVNDLDDDLPNDLGALFPIIESAEGLLNAGPIMSNGRVTLALFGAVDYAADLDCTLGWDSLLMARSTLANAAAAYDVQLFDVPYINVKDLEGCEVTTRKAKDLGIHARAAIHPAQIAPIHAALTPNLDEITQAEAVIAAYQKADGNVALLDGKLIEAPLVKKAERILAIGKRI